MVQTLHNSHAFSSNRPDDPQVAALKLPPHSIEAEQSLIGGLLLDNTRLGPHRRHGHRDATSIATTTAASSATSRKLIETGRPADVVTVFESIEKRNEVEQTGGLAYLGEIANNTPSAANIRRYAEIVRERAVLRKLVTVGDEIAASALNPAGRDVKTLLDEAEPRSSRSPRPARAVDPGLRRRSSRCWARWSSASRSSTTARILPTSPACRPASPISTR